MKIKWTAEMDALLGTMSDQEVADGLGISWDSVIYRRSELDIPCWYRTIWTPEMDALLGTMVDRKVAAKLGIGGQVVRRRRQGLGIPSWASSNRVLPWEVSVYDLEAKQIYQAHRKHKQLNLPDTLTYEQWKFACEWFDNCCAYCGEQTFLTEDHLVPVSKGGPRTALNIIPACGSCNNSKRAKQAHLWIYEHFGMTEGKRIVERIVAYLTEVRDDN